MTHHLFLLRHAEAEQESAGGDINRPLTPRGLQSIEYIGKDLRARNERMEMLCSSTAVRAAATARGVSGYLRYAADDIVWKPELYLAGLSELLALLAECPVSCNQLMLVGHNPGLEKLMTYLAATDNSLTTATLAKLETTESWSALQPGCAKLIYLLKPG
ncbi:MAG TPA: histidine phosphatase family protein [Gammaproteobacteria bacterium]